MKCFFGYKKLIANSRILINWVTIHQNERAILAVSSFCRHKTFKKRTDFIHRLTIYKWCSGNWELGNAKTIILKCYAENDYFLISLSHFRSSYIAFHYYIFFLYKFFFSLLGGLHIVSFFKFIAP